jgi:isoleucyl-tRNA synthetase
MIKKYEKKQILNIEEKLPYILTVIQGSNLKKDRKKSLSKSLNNLVKELKYLKENGVDFV